MEPTDDLTCTYGHPLGTVVCSQCEDIETFYDSWEDDINGDSDFWGDPETCSLCNESVDYCQGHGEIGDPDGFAMLQEMEE